MEHLQRVRLCGHAVVWSNGCSQENKKGTRHVVVNSFIVAKTSDGAYVVDLHVVAVQESLDKVLNVERTVHPRAFETSLRVERDACTVRRCTLAFQRFFGAVCLSFFRLHGGVFCVHQIAQIFVVHGDCGALHVRIHSLYADTFLSRAL